ncbi:OmpA family protein [Oscillatoriales cyanobacterium LEGE 11467]|uniref:OmpA family protein n=2 Tax=Zarconia TaxID=2992130 RepID=A0A928VUF4_9CYAN|nr:OmpA family protein [Zarconia navalis LEGE 11467]
MNYFEELETDTTETPETGIWLSVGDLMSGLLMLFALLFITVQLQLQQKLSEVAKLERELEAKIAQLERYQDVFDRLPLVILTAIESELGGSDVVSVDPSTGEVSIRDRILFDRGSATLKSEGKQFLQEFIPIYSQVIFSNEEFDRQITRILIEGHTSSQGSEDSNLELSLRRALSVANYIFSDEISFTTKSNLKQKILAAGRGEIEADTNTDNPGDRKVVFRFQLRQQPSIAN